MILEQANRCQRALLAAVCLLALAVGIAPVFAAVTRTTYIYRKVAGKSLLADVYMPEGRGPFPGVVLAHGGGWVMSSRREVNIVYCADLLARNGIVAFAVDYRLAPKYTYPAPLDDVRYGIRCLRYNAKQLRVDPDRIAVLGTSAGGLFSNLIGVLPDDGDPQAKDLVARQSSRVRAVVSFYALGDLRDQMDSEAVRTLMGPLAEGDGAAQAFARASPIVHISKDDPPFLLLHGTADTVVPYQASQSFYDALVAAGVSAKLVGIPGGDHMLAAWPELPDPPDWQGILIEWLKTHLGD